MNQSSARHSHVHSIRLVGPWELRVSGLVVEGGSQTPSPQLYQPSPQLYQPSPQPSPKGRGGIQGAGSNGVKYQIKVPLKMHDLPTACFGQPFTLTRRFNCPTGLTPEQVIWLVVDSDVNDFAVALNDRELAAATDDKRSVTDTAQRFAIGELLPGQNMLTVQMPVILSSQHQTAGEKLVLRNVWLEIKGQTR